MHQLLVFGSASGAGMINPVAGRAVAAPGFAGGLLAAVLVKAL